MNKKIYKYIAIIILLIPIFCLNKKEYVSQNKFVYIPSNNRMNYPAIK